MAPTSVPSFGAAVRPSSLRGAPGIKTRGGREGAEGARGFSRLRQVQLQCNLLEGQIPWIWEFPCTLQSRERPNVIALVRHVEPSKMGPVQKYHPGLPGHPSQPLSDNHATTLLEPLAGRNSAK